MLQPLPGAGRRSLHEEEGVGYGVGVGLSGYESGGMGAGGGTGGHAAGTPSPPPPTQVVGGGVAGGVAGGPVGGPIVQGPVQDPPPRKSSKNALVQVSHPNPTANPNPNPNPHAVNGVGGVTEKIIPQSEDIKRLLQECRYSMGNASLLGNALVHAKPEDVKRDPIIKVRFFVSFLKFFSLYFILW